MQTMLSMSAPYSRGLAMCLCVTAVCSMFTNAVARIFGFVPAHTFSVHAYPWNLLTYIAVEPNPLLCALSVAFLLRVGASVESSMGSFAYMQLLLVVSTATSILLLVLSAVLYPIGVTWFLQCFCGIWPVAGALLVPWIAAAPAARSAAPAMLLVIALAIDILFHRGDAVGEKDVGGEAVFIGSVSVPALIGFGIAWARGAGGHLELAALLQPIAALVRRRTEPVPAAGETSFARGTTAVHLLPGSTEEDAERRRAIAIAALASRMQQQQQQKDAPASPASPGGAARNDLPI